MSFDVGSPVEILLEDYAAAIAATVVVYDYILNFSREIDFIWVTPCVSSPRPPSSYTIVTIVQTLVMGLYVVCPSPLYGLLLYLMPLEVFLSPPFLPQCTVYALAMNWAMLVFFAAADLVMILRVYAMWGCSRRILGALLLLYLPQIIISLVFNSISSNISTYLSVKTPQVPNIFSCDVLLYAPFSYLSFGVIRFVFSVELSTLAIVQTIRQSLAMYRATKQWQPNRYLGLMLRDGIIYCLVHVLHDLLYVISWGESTFYAIPFQSLAALPHLILFSLSPRFIVGLRELYDRDVRRRGMGIDTGFGMLTQPTGVGETVGLSTIRFADVPENQDTEADADDSEALISLDVDSARQV